MCLDLGVGAYRGPRGQTEVTLGLWKCRELGTVVIYLQPLVIVNSFLFFVHPRQALTM